MAYCTAQDLIDRFGERELRDCADLGEDAAVEGAIVQAAIDDASAEIDAYLGTRCRVPIRRRVPVLVLLACQIARYRLLDGREHEQAQRRYEEAVEMLKALAAGDVTLGVGADDAQEPSPSAGAAAVHVERHPFDSAARDAFLGRLR